MRLSLARRLMVAVSWTPVAAVCVGGLALVEASRLSGHADGAVLERGRWVLLLAAGCLSFTLDDPAANLLASSPTPLWARRVHRVAVGAAALVVGAAAVGWRAGLFGGTLPSRAELDVVIEVAAYAALGLAVAAVAARSEPRSGGYAGVIAVFAVMTTARLLPEGIGLFPVTPFAEGARRALTTDLVVGVAVTAVLSRDLAGRRRLPRAAGAFARDRRFSWR